MVSQGRGLVASTTRVWAPTAVRGAAQAAAEEGTTNSECSVGITVC